MSSSEQTTGASASDPARAIAGHAGPSAAAAALRAALPLATLRCLLRVVGEQDVAEVRAYRGLSDVARFLGHPPLGDQEARGLVAGWLEDTSAMTVVAEHGGRVVGDVCLRFRPSAALAPATTTAVEAGLGYAFHPDVAGQGLATECVRAVVDLARGPGAARRVTARVFAPAQRSSRLLTRIGFTCDGVDRQAVLSPDGAQWWDDELWSLVRE